MRPSYPSYPSQGQQPQQTPPPNQGYGAPPPGAYGAPPPTAGYGAPPPGAGGPPVGYGQPPPGAPGTGYGAPPPTNQPPPPGGWGGPPPAAASNQPPAPGGWGAPPPQNTTAPPATQPPQNWGAPPPQTAAPGGYGGAPPPGGPPAPTAQPGGWGAAPPQPQTAAPGGWNAGPPQGTAPPPTVAPGGWSGQPPAGVTGPGMTTGGVMAPGMTTGAPVRPPATYGGAPAQPPQPAPTAAPPAAAGPPANVMRPGMTTGPGGVVSQPPTGITQPGGVTQPPVQPQTQPQPPPVTQPGGAAPRPSYPGAGGYQAPAPGGFQPAGGAPPGMPPSGGAPPTAGPPMPGGRAFPSGPLPPVSGGAHAPPVFINPQSVAPRSTHPAMAPTTQGIGAGGGASHIGQQMANLSMGEPARPPTNWDPVGLEPLAEKFPLQAQEGQTKPNYMRLTVNAFPNSTALAQRFGLPIGIVIQPMSDLTPVPLVNFGASGVIRCRRCRTYVNPFVAFMDAGRRWRCNVCGLINDLPAEYFCNLDVNNKRKDLDERPELREGTVEFVAPQDYMMRTPQPPVYVFVVDVSVRAVSSGMLRVAAQTIRNTIDEMQADPRTQVALITFDSTFTFYNLRAGLSQPQALVVPDIENPFLPVPNDLLVYLSESKDLFITLLEKLPSLYQDTDIHESCLGPALHAAHMLMMNLGGKMVVFQSTLPSLGRGALQPREDVKLLGTEKEVLMLQPANDFYKTLAMDCSKNQVCVDLFTFPQQYIDLATLSALTKFTGGQLYYYPGFDAGRDGDVFAHDLRNTLMRVTGFEAVMRVRCTKGVKVSSFHGNYYLRGTDLLALPNVDSEKAFTCELAHEEQTLTSSHVCMQCALLYTTATGERRIRVHTLNVPIVSEIRDLYAAIDPDTMVTVLAKSAVDLGISTKLAEARTKLQDRFVQGLRVFRAMMQTIALPKQLELTPLMVLAALKNTVLRDGVDVRTDERTYLAVSLGGFGVAQTKAFLLPSLFAIHTLPQGNYGGIQGGQVVMPPLHPLTLEHLSQDGVYLIENGMFMMLWVGKNSNPQLVTDLLNVPNADRLDSCKYEIPQLENDINNRLQNVIRTIRAARPSRMPLYIVRQGGASENKFLSLLIEDRTVATMSYAEFWTSLARTLG